MGADVTRRRGARAAGAALWLIATGLTALPAVAADPSAGAKAFVDGLYRAYERTGRSPPEDGRVFAPELARLIARDAAIATRQGEPNLIDYVLLCGCQDDEGLRYATRVVTTTSQGVTIRVTSHLRGSDDGRPFDLLVTRTPAGWRIADIVTPVQRRRESLLATLRNGLSGRPQPASPPAGAADRTRQAMSTAGCREPDGPTRYTVPCDRYVAITEVRTIAAGTPVRAGVNPAFPVLERAAAGERLEVTGRIHSGGIWWVGGWKMTHFASGDSPGMAWVPLTATTLAAH